MGVTTVVTIRVVVPQTATQILATSLRFSLAGIDLILSMISIALL